MDLYTILTLQIGRVACPQEFSLEREVYTEHTTDECVTRLWHLLKYNIQVFSGHHPVLGQDYRNQLSGSHLICQSRYKIKGIFLKVPEACGEGTVYSPVAEKREPGGSVLSTNGGEERMGVQR